MGLWPSHPNQGDELGLGPWPASWLFSPKAPPLPQAAWGAARLLRPRGIAQSTGVAREDRSNRVLILLKRQILELPEWWPRSPHSSEGCWPLQSHPPGFKRSNFMPFLPYFIKLLMHSSRTYTYHYIAADRWHVNRTSLSFPWLNHPKRLKGQVFN